MTAISEFFAMGGYAFYVWTSYGVTALFMLIEMILVMRNRRTMLQRIARIIRANSQVDK